MASEGNKPLKNPRHERFTQLVASGIKPVDAYISVGYSQGGAPQAANNLLKRTDVKVRIEWIQTQAAMSAANKAAFDQERVLNRLDVLSRAAEEAGQFSAATRCEELIGRARGMFIDRADHTVKWDGDVTKLTQQQLDVLIASLSARLFGDDQAAREAAEREALEGMGTVQ